MRGEPTSDAGGLGLRRGDSATNTLNSPTQVERQSATPLFAPKKILCAVDLSPASAPVLGWAGLFAQNFDAKLEVVHAEWAEYPPYFLLSQEEELAAQVEERRAAIRKALANIAHTSLASTIAPETTVVEGHAVEAILKHAEARQPDLIVIGSHGRSGMARMRLGSVAETVMREAGTPVLVVRSPANRDAPKAISRILCPVSLADQAPQRINFSAELASAFGAQLIVVHAAEHESQDLEAIRKQLCGSIPAGARQSCKVVEIVRRGNPAEQIVLAAREYVVDLIVIAAHHHRFLEFTTLGTTTERVVRHADSAVLVLPSDTSQTRHERLSTSPRDESGLSAEETPSGELRPGSVAKTLLIAMSRCVQAVAEFVGLAGRAC
jgi:nucleotide-binding universal stress UspA family protein